MFAVSVLHATSKKHVQAERRLQVSAVRATRAEARTLTDELLAKCYASRYFLSEVQRWRVLAPCMSGSRRPPRRGGTFSRALTWTARPSLARAGQRQRGARPVIPRASITAWRKVAPWPDNTQVDQDLVLSRVVVELLRRPTFAEGAVCTAGCRTPPRLPFCCR